MLSFTWTIRRCGGCHELIDDRNYNRGGIIFTNWTDGKVNNAFKNLAGDCSGDHFLVKCPHCLSCEWFDFLEVDSQASMIWGTMDRLNTSTALSVPLFKDYCEKIESGDITEDIEYGGVTEDMEINYRMIMWRVGNDRRRDIRKEKPLIKEEIENLERLFQLINKQDDTAFGDAHRSPSYRIEIKRELGLFDEAMELYAEYFGSKSEKEHGNFIKKLIEKKDSTVRAYTYK